MPSRHQASSKSDGEVAGLDVGDGAVDGRRKSRRRFSEQGLASDVGGDSGGAGEAGETGTISWCALIERRADEVIRARGVGDDE